MLWERSVLGVRIPASEPDDSDEIVASYGCY
jgi:hypothetical protein